MNVDDLSRKFMRRYLAFRFTPFISALSKDDDENHGNHMIVLNFYYHENR